MNIKSAGELESEVLLVFAEVTRYPLDILDPEASLEEDLGIDSVKLGEIFSVIRERYSLPERLDIPPESLRTVRSISLALGQYLLLSAEPIRTSVPSGAFAAAAGGERKDAAAQTEPTAARYSPASFSPPALQVRGNGSAGPPSQSGAPPSAVRLRHQSLEATRTRLQKIFADVTRYPPEILDFEASLEEDLGIDSVKLGEIFSVVREEYGLPEKLDIPVERLKTIAGIAEALQEYLTALESGRPGAADAYSSALRTALVRTDVPVPDAGASGNGAAGSALRHRTLSPATSQPLKRQPSQSESSQYESSQSRTSTYAYDSRAAEPLSLHSMQSARMADALRHESKPFKGKVTFISGSGRALGKDIAVYLAELGSTVVVNSFHSRNLGEQTAAEINDLGGDAWHLWGSMANPGQLHRMFDQVEERYGKLDFFISNASNGMLAPIEDLTVEHWEKAFRTNVVGLHQAAVRAAQIMKRNGGGKIITLSSPAAHGYVEYFGCMGSVKAAVEALTRALAIEFARYNIQVNCVSPGPIDGELLRKWPESERLIKQWTDATPLGRLCEHRDVSHFIAYLLSRPVKAFTGSVLVLDGGISAQGW